MLNLTPRTVAFHRTGSWNNSRSPRRRNSFSMPSSTTSSERQVVRRAVVTDESAV